MLAAIQVLIPAMKTAFYTSVWGIGLATLFMLLEKWMVSHVSSAAEQTLVGLHDRFVEETPSLYLRQHHDQSGVIRELRTTVETFRTSLETARKTSSPETVAHLVQEGLDRTVEAHLAEPFRQIAARLSSLDEMKVHSQKLQENNERLSRFIMEDLQGVFDSVRASIDSAGEAMHDTRRALETTNEAMDKQRVGLEAFVGEMNEVLDRQKEAFEATAGTIRDHFDDTAKHIFTRYDAFNEQMQGMGNLFGEVADRFQTVSTAAARALEEQGQQHKTMLDDQRSLNEETFSKISELLESKLDEIAERTRDTLEEAMSRTAEASVRLIDQAGTAFREVVSQTNDRLQSTLGQVGTELENTSERVQQELSRFREDYTRALLSFFEEQRIILEEQLAQNTERLHGVVEELQRAFEAEHAQKKELHVKNQAILDRLEAVVAGNVALTEMQKESVRQLAEKTVEGTTQIAGSLGRSSKALEGIHTAVEHVAASISKEVLEQVEQFAAKQADILRQYQSGVDEHLGEILGQLTSAAEIVAAAIASQLDDES